ncbi:cell division protein ZapA [Hyphomonas sp.]|jgi:cell division protein ZapA|uniref:cell division protein ZapA n=1 Tax=Hyphomonas sp. TaxID=87 RepID=UPI0004075279|nr:cell division protein ZapA [Hyphomonas sp.]MEE2921729.1 cell division protein ZapA [Pseudomonadota bacterium]
MAKADIQLRGRAYSIACAPGQEGRIETLSRQLDARVKQIEGAVGDIGEERLLLITALALLDELDTARRSAPGSSASEAKAAEALVKAASRITALAERMESGV